MRITCSTLDGFLENLRTSAVYQGLVFVEREARPLNGTTKRDATSFEIGLRVATVIEYEDGGQALLEAVEVCGVDRLTRDGDQEGTRLQTELIKQLNQVCNDKGLQVRPGMLDL